MRVLDFEPVLRFMHRKLTTFNSETHICMSPWFVGPTTPIHHPQSTSTLPRMRPQHFEPPNKASQAEVESVTPISYQCDDDGK